MDGLDLVIDALDFVIDSLDSVYDTFHIRVDALNRIHQHLAPGRISKMTCGWATGSVRVARIPIPVILDHIYTNSSHSNQD